MATRTGFFRGRSYSAWPGRFLAVLAMLVPLLRATAAETGIPADLGPMLEHAAIVEEMVQTCAELNPELADELAAAWRDWRQRNGRVGEAIETTTRLAATATGSTIIYLYHALQTSLQKQSKAFEEMSTDQYASRCKAVLANLVTGRLDYRPLDPTK
jgi:uncharacterized protein with beta-barrel porin domain